MLFERGVNRIVAMTVRHYRGLCLYARARAGSEPSSACISSAHCPARRTTAVLEQVFSPIPSTRWWLTCAAEAGLPEGLRFTGGHTSRGAALIYQHATSKRNREIAAAIDARID
jgi:hypothetical protein